MSNLRRRSNVRSAPLFALSLLPLMISATAHAAGGPALPTGGKVVTGSAVISTPSGGGLTINQSSSKAIITWNGFSIGQGGTVTFDNGSGATLNRVTGTGTSYINGLLNATGSVYLINANGVIIGKTGVVNVGGTFVASTLNVTDSNFMLGGDLAFTGPSTASVINLGKVGALGGDVAMLATTVENEGTITAPNGTVGLAAGSSVLLRDAALDDGKFAVLVGGAGTSVSNSGLIAAANAELRAEGGNVYALAGDTDGVIRATGVKSGDGKVWLVAEGGTLDVAGTIDAQGANGTGGQIETSGQTVKLGASSINAHGGAWLVDPTDLTIDATAATTIDNALNAGTSVTEQTNAGAASGAGTQNANGAGDIIVAAPIAWSTTAALTLSAYHDIDVTAGITTSGGGALTLVTDNSGAGNGGTLVFAPGASVQFTGYASSQPTGSLSIGVGTAAPTAYTLVSDLATLARDITANNSGAYALATSVDGSNGGEGYSSSLLISPVMTGFAGTLEGLGNSVTNLIINAPQATNVGLFDLIGTTGVVRDLNLVGGSVTGLYSVGSLAGENDGLVTSVTASTAVTADVSNEGDAAGGLVGYNTGTINLSSASGAVSGYTAVGGLVGIDNGGSSAQPGVIENSFATGPVTTGSGLAGGLVGQAYGASASGAQFINDYATGAVSDTGVYGTDSPGQDGGLIGDLLSGVVSGSYATGAVTSAQGYAVGGLIGYVGRTGNVTISDSYATGAVSTFNDAGGLIGEVRAPEDDGNVSRPGVLTITNSYATGSAIAIGYDAGGLIGGLYQEASTSGNGAYGPPVSNANTVISNVFATGYVYSPSVAGGLIGKNPGTVTITNGYYATDTTGQTTDNAGGVGESTAALQSALPTGFDPGTWGIVAGSSFPYLLSQFATGVTPEVISGIDYDVASNGTFASLVGVVRNGTALGQVSTGANGYYYLLAAPSGNAAPVSGAVQDSILVYQADGSTQGASFVQTNAANPQGATDLTIFGNGLQLSTVQSSLSALIASLATDAAAAPADALNFTLPASGGVATSAANVGLFTSGDFVLDGGLNVSSASGPGNLNLSINGSLTQTAGFITANALTGAATSFNLPNANLVTALGLSNGVGLSATSGLVFTNAQALTVAGPVSGGTGTTSVSTTAGDLTIASTGSVSGDLILASAGNLNISGNVTATDGGLTLQADTDGTDPGATVTIASGVTVSAMTSGGAAAPINIAVDDPSDFINNGMTNVLPTIFQNISTLAGLEAINANLSGDYALNANINGATDTTLNGAAFTPIGGNNGFSGVLDGVNHTISNLTINDTTDTFVGLFGLVTGTVQNVNLTNANITGGTNRTGGLVGFLSGGSVLNSSVSGVVNGGQYGKVGGLVGYGQSDTISNSSSSALVIGDYGSDVGGLVGYQISAGSITGSFATGAVASGANGFAGGLLGYSFVGSVSNSYATGGISVGSGGIAGGLVGMNDRASIATSFATGAVTDGGAGARALGGLVGYNTGEGGVATISQSFAAGTVTGAANFIGGLVGVNAGYDVLAASYVATNSGYQYAGTASITDVYATGAVAGPGGSSVGGLVGYNFGGFDGLYGTGAGTASIINAYATGAVSGQAGSNLGGLVGYSSASGGLITLSHVYFDQNTTGQATDGGNDGTADENTSTSYATATPLTTAQLQDGATPVFALSSNFVVTAGLYPYLAAFYPTAPQAISGTAYSDAGVTPLASSSGMLTADAVTNYVTLQTGDQVTTGANGYYYIMPAPVLANGAFSTPTALTTATAYTSAAPAGAPLGSAPLGAVLGPVTAQTTGFDIYGGYQRFITPDTLYSTASADLAAADLSQSAAIAALAPFYASTGASFTIDQPLNLNANLSVQTTTTGAPIVVNDTITLNGTNALALLAAGALTVNADITVSGAGAVTLAAATDPTYGVELSFAPGASLSYMATGTASGNDALGAPLGSLVINGQAYTLLNELSQTGATAPDAGVQDIAGIDSAGLAGYYALVGNVSGAGTTYTSALVGAGGATFTGAFDGLGHTITGLTIADTTPTDAYTGLFGESSGAIRNIGLVGGSVTQTTNDSTVPEVGALVGSNSGAISNAYATGAVSVTGGYGDVGGLVGNNAGAISNAYAAGAVASGSGGQDSEVGGLAGRNTGDISHAYATGAVTGGSGKGFVGGLAGYNAGMIDTAFATGAATSGNTSDVGGLVGENVNGSITRAYATGAAIGANSSDDGGLVGLDQGSNGAISQVYATGYVGTGGSAGGLIGENMSTGSVTDAYFDTNTTGQTVGARGANVGTGDTTAVLQGTLPTGFDPAVWSTGAGLYPYLASFFPNGVQAITTTVTGGGFAGGQVAFYANGGQLGNGGTASVGANGYVYQLFAAGTVPTSGALGDTLTPSGSTTPIALSYTDTPTLAQVSVAPSLTTELVSLSTQETTYTALLGDLANTFGSANYTNVAGEIFNISPFSGAFLINAATSFTVDQAISGYGSETIDAQGGALTVNAALTSSGGGVSLTSNAGGAITLGADVSADGTVTLTSDGAIDQTAGALTAGTLTGSSNNAPINLTSATNAVTTVSALTVMTGAGDAGYGIDLVDNAPLTISGAVATGTGAITISETNGALTVAAGGSVSMGAGGQDITLQSSGDVDVAGSITQVGDGSVILSAGDTGSGTGTVTLTGATPTVTTGGYVAITYNPVGGYSGPNASTQTYSGTLTQNPTTGAYSYTGGGYTYANPYTAQVDLTGDGKLTATMLVNNLTNLQAIGTNATSLAGLYTLYGDIDASSTGTTGAVANNGGLGFTPIGNGLTGAFTGAFDGAGHTISGLTETPVAGTTYLGLFGQIGAGGSLANLTLSNVAITGYGYTGGVVGDLSGTVSNVNVSGTVNGAGGTGGVTGVAEGGSTIFDAGLTAAVTGTGDDVGGLAGASFGSISSSYSTGTVTGVKYVGGVVGLNYGSIYHGGDYGGVSGVEYVGGLVGWNDASGAISRSSASAPGGVTATATGAADSGDYAGGLVGVNKGSISVSYVYQGTVTGVGLVGGLIGLNRGSVTTSYSQADATGDLYVGGLVGWNDTGATVNTSIAFGAVTGTTGGEDASGNDYVGGAVGVNFGSLTDSYATGAVSGVKVVGGLVGTNMPGASVTTSYAIGAVSATNGAAGAVFGANSGEVTSVYGFPGFSGQPVASGYLSPTASGDATLLTNAQASDQAAYVGFDFDTTWIAGAYYLTPYGAPTLQWYDNENN